MNNFKKLTRPFQENLTVFTEIEYTLKNVRSQNMYFAVRHMNSFNNLIVSAAKIL